MKNLHFVSYTQYTLAVYSILGDFILDWAQSFMDKFGKTSSILVCLLFSNYALLIMYNPHPGISIYNEPI